MSTGGAVTTTAGRQAPRPTSRSENSNTQTSAAGSGVLWLIARALAVVLLSVASGLLYYAASSDEYRVSKVVLLGNKLLPTAELEDTAGVHGANIFWVRQQEVTERLQALPAIQSARVSAHLPNRVEIRISERTPVAIWQSERAAHLVDRDGTVLGTSPATSPELLTIRDVDRSEPRPGGTVDADALQTSARLQKLLPDIAKTTPREFEYSRETGVSVMTDWGVRVRFGNGSNLEWKVNALAALRRELERSGQRADLIDLRFNDRPYIR